MCAKLMYLLISSSLKKINLKLLNYALPFVCSYFFPVGQPSTFQLGCENGEGITRSETTRSIWYLGIEFLGVVDLIRSEQQENKMRLTVKGCVSFYIWWYFSILYLFDDTIMVSDLLHNRSISNCKWKFHFIFSLYLPFLLLDDAFNYS